MKQSRCCANCCRSSRRSLCSSKLTWGTNSWKPVIMLANRDVVYSRFHWRCLLQQMENMPSYYCVDHLECSPHTRWCQSLIREFVSRVIKGQTKSTWSKQSLWQLHNALRRRTTLHLNQAGPMQTNLGVEWGYVRRRRRREQCLFY